MFLRTETRTLGGARRELDEKLDEQADRVASLPDDAPDDVVTEERTEGLKFDRYRNGIEWAINEWDADATIELGAITTGSRDFITELTELHNCPQRNAYIAVGTIEAPFLEHDAEDMPTNPNAVGDTIKKIPDFHPAFADWLNTSIGELGQMEGDTGKSFQKLVREKRLSETSTDEN